MLVSDAKGKYLSEQSSAGSPCLGDVSRYGRVQSSSSVEAPGGSYARRGSGRLESLDLCVRSDHLLPSSHSNELMEVL